MGTSLFFLTASAPEGFDWRAFLAPFHSVMLHFPIGFVTLACLLDLYYLRNRHAEIRRLSFLLMSLCALSAMVVAALGLLRASGGGYEDQALASHRFWGISVTVVLVATLIAQRWASHRPGQTVVQAAYRLCLFGSLAILVVTGHLGGSLTYGSGYLVKNAPAFVKAMFEPGGQDSTNGMSGADASTDAGEQLFLSRVQPILKKKCHQCHGPEKQKGDYRLDNKESAFKGGESEEPAITPGDARASFLAELILLPEDHDDVMPPAGKERLTAEEILTLIRWIQSGAPYPSTPEGMREPESASPPG